MTISVVICAYSDRRWSDLKAAIASLERQTTPPHEIILVIDHNHALLERSYSAWPTLRVIGNPNRRGLSGARNAGVAAASGEIVAFLDDDARADERWLAELSAAYRDPLVLGVGGQVDPVWLSSRPTWFPPEFDWVVGCTHSGMPSETAPVRNLVGANMSFRRATLVELGGFRDGIGRVGATPVGCEETEFCIRARQRWRDHEVVYVPAAKVLHTVPSDRATVRYFVSRCWAEGASKALVSQLVGSSSGLASERSYVLNALPLGVARDVRSALMGRGAATRPIMATLGLMATTFGYGAGRLRTAFSAHNWERTVLPAKG